MLLSSKKKVTTVLGGCWCHCHSWMLMSLLLHLPYCCRLPSLCSWGLCVYRLKCLSIPTNIAMLLYSLPLVHRVYFINSDLGILQTTLQMESANIHAEWRAVHQISRCRWILNTEWHVAYTFHFKHLFGVLFVCWLLLVFNFVYLVHTDLYTITHIVFLFLVILWL